MDRMGQGLLVQQESLCTIFENHGNFVVRELP